MADPFTKAKLALLDRANADPCLTHLDFRVLYYLTSAMDRTTGVARRRQNVVAEALGTKGARGIQKSIDRLVAGSYLVVESGRYAGQANSYSLPEWLEGTNAGSYPVRTEAQQGTNTGSQGYEPPFVHDTSLSLSLVESPESERARARGILLPEDFKLTDENYIWALDLLGVPEAVDRSLERFRDHYRQVAGGAAYSRDWQSKARLWIGADAREPFDRAVKMKRARINAAVDRAVKELDGTLTPTEAEWRAVLSHYAKTEQWTRYVNRFGPDPTSPACHAPAELLSEYGIRKAAA
ncbi:hypothetical protein [Bradyrhizobium sp. CCBAU 53338]|uniref:hypothetical protein n=1 Tax=Bradyrhizobium sp. CCBAU 53338 TaxID=1325111 RepID=UPI00188B897E|nr:hypothetical protein [Bradyrhizobium sp. CCBAU 53338]QOZ52864.1 hypothetical protein XH90_16960 [Bradyrhizobium sp. CCBAU 53338]